MRPRKAQRPRWHKTDKHGGAGRQTHENRAEARFFFDAANLFGGRFALARRLVRLYAGFVASVGPASPPGVFFSSALRRAFSSAFFFFSSSRCRFSYWKFVFAICYLYIHFSRFETT